MVTNSGLFLMKVTKILQDQTVDDLTAPRLSEEFSNSISILAENLAVAMAEHKRWESIEEVSSEALVEAMKILDVVELRSSFCTFKLNKGDLEVLYEGGHLH